MATVAVLNSKGGVGKTSLAVQLAATRAYYGRKVLLVNCDIQDSALQAIAQRADNPRRSAITVAHITDAKALLPEILKAQPVFDDIVIDCGGRHNEVLRAALTIADCSVVPFAPRSFDVWGVADVAAAVAEAIQKGLAVKVVAVLSQADALGQDNEQAIAAVREMPPLQYLDSPVGRRKCIPEASSFGCSVLEMAGTTPEARHEIRRLTDRVFDLAESH